MKKGVDQNKEQIIEYLSKENDNLKKKIDSMSIDISDFIKKGDSVFHNMKMELKRLKKEIFLLQNPNGVIYSSPYNYGAKYEYEEIYKLEVEFYDIISFQKKGDYLKIEIEGEVELELFSKFKIYKICKDKLEEIDINVGNMFNDCEKVIVNKRKGKGAL